jgi:hypothetical protein
MLDIIIKISRLILSGDARFRRLSLRAEAATERCANPAPPSAARIWRGRTFESGPDTTDQLKSSSESCFLIGGPYRDRTGHLIHAMDALYQMS